MNSKGVLCVCSCWSSETQSWSGYYIIVTSPPCSFIKQQTERCCANRNERWGNNTQELIQVRK